MERDDLPPVVLHHGLFGGTKSIAGLKFAPFKGIGRAIAARGHDVLVTEVHPSAPVEHRARQLAEIIQGQSARFGGRRIVIVAQSMGGLDARFMLANLGMAKYVRALLTISTPHRGSSYADWCVRHFGKRLGALRLARELGWDLDGVLDLTTEQCAAFNRRIPNVPGVRYYSVSASRPWHLVPPWGMLPWKIIHRAEGANDAQVSVRSAIWGEHLGTWPADHWHTTNSRWVLELRNPTGDITPYYLDALQAVVAKSAA